MSVSKVCGTDVSENDSKEIWNSSRIALPENSSLRTSLALQCVRFNSIAI